MHAFHTHLAERRSRDVVEGTERRVSGWDLALEDLAISCHPDMKLSPYLWSSDREQTGSVVESRRIGKLGLGNGLFNFLILGRAGLLDCGRDLLGKSLDTLGGGGRDGNGEERSIRVWQQGGVNGSSWNFFGDQGERRGTGTPLDRRGTANEMGQDLEVGGCRAGGTEGDGHGGSGVGVVVRVEGDSLFTSEVLRRTSVDR